MTAMLLRLIFGVPAISRLTTLTVELLWTASTETGDIEADNTDSGIAMNCANRNRKTPHLGD